MVMSSFLAAGVIDRSSPIHMYSATSSCCTNQTKVTKGLLLEEWPSPCKNGPIVKAQISIYECCTYQGLGWKLALLPLYKGPKRSEGGDSSPAYIFCAFGALSFSFSTTWRSYIPTQAKSLYYNRL
jgi:hypothetical protein